MDLSKRISNAIDHSGLKKKFVAERINVSDQTLSAIISGGRKITVEEFFNLCCVLNVSADELYYGSNQ
ncbi:MAG: helix-turn-helix transcriptional regulator [Lachnospiraceae bacterium]|nr:helix-turn-helix transcriptional regulator [Lachnospiraceae bacterium]